MPRVETPKRTKPRRQPMVGAGMTRWPGPGEWRRWHRQAAIWTAAALVMLLWLKRRELLWSWRIIRGAEMTMTMARVQGVTTGGKWFAGRNRSTTVHGRFEFEVEGVTYSGTDFGRGEGVPRFKGDQLKRDLNRVGLVQVWYNAKDPSQCHADLGYGPPHSTTAAASYRDLTLLFILAGTSGLLWATLPLQAIARRRRQQRLGLWPPSPPPPPPAPRRVS